MTGSAPAQRRGGYCFAQLITAAIMLLAAALSQLVLGNPWPGIILGVVLAFCYWVYIFWRQGAG